MWRWHAQTLAYRPRDMLNAFQFVERIRIEAWGVESYDIEDTNSHCKSLVSCEQRPCTCGWYKFSLPYLAKSFSLVIASYALDYLSPEYLNKKANINESIASPQFMFDLNKPQWLESHTFISREQTRRQFI